MKKVVLFVVVAVLMLTTSGFVTSRVQGRNQKFIKRPNAIPNRYIVVLNEEAVGYDMAAPTVESNAQYLAGIYGGNVNSVYSSALKGFVAEMSSRQAQALSNDSSVLFVEQDSEISVASTQFSPGWNLDRVDQRNLPWDGAYNYTSTGAGVHAYIIDTGIRPTHVEFQGRASAVYDNVGDGQNGIDCNGHGTHVAGIIGAATYGVAKGVFLHGVRVIPCNGSGQISNLIAGIDWVTANRVNPAVANISLAAAGSSPSLETSLTNSINSGVTYSVAAGNGNWDACNFTPARTPAALTVGASDETDLRALFSNGGACVDLFAPGNRIDSTWSSSDTAINNLSGSSMAAPMVAGVAALYLQAHPSASSATVSSSIMSTVTTGVLNTLDTTSPNKLLYSLINGAPAPTPTPTPTATPTPTPTATPTPTPTPRTVRVTVRKRAQGTMTEGSSTTQFPYSAVNLSTSSFALDINQDYIDSNAQPGTSTNPIVIQEASVTGWQLMSIACIDPTTGAPSNSSVDLTNHKVSVIADASQQVDCTFTSQQLSPTAAPVSISGRVLDTSGRGLRGVTVKLIDLLGGTTAYVRTNSFGFYSFDGVTVSRTYVVAVSSTKRWNIANNFRTVTPTDDLIGVNFTVLPY
jgi:subtilisin family serine protease